MRRTHVRPPRCRRRDRPTRTATRLRAGEISDLAATSGGGALEPELLEAPGARAAGVVVDQLPALAAEPIEHRAGVAGLALELPAGELDAHPCPLRLRVVGRDDRGVLPGGHGHHGSRWHRAHPEGPIWFRPDPSVTAPPGLASLHAPDRTHCVCRRGPGDPGPPRPPPAACRTHPPRGTARMLRPSRTRTAGSRSPRPATTALAMLSFIGMAA